MKKTITLKAAGMAFAISASLNAFCLHAQDQVYTFKNNSGKEGYSIQRKDDKGIAVDFSISRMTVVDNTINGEKMKNLAVSGMLLQNEAGYPDLPGNCRYLAVPQGGKAVLKSVSYSTETIKNIEVTPAPVIPLATDNSPLKYIKNPEVYSRNAFFPESPVKLFDSQQIRGVDATMLGVTPFQYNPVTKELIVYYNIQIEISFEGGNGHFGNDDYRSRWWEPILQDLFLNYDQLTPVNEVRHYNLGYKTTSTDTGCEYAIIIPNGTVFKQWADSIKKFRREQGILTDIFTLNDIGSTTAAGIQTWVQAAYNTWTIKPAAMLILGDYGSDANSTVTANLYPHDDASYPAFASDNYYADVTGDNLPDIIFSRIFANNASELQVLCSKFLNYERNPPIDPAFYNKPLIAMGWQDDRWFQVCAEVVGGFLKSIGKNQTRANALGSPASNTGNNVANTGNWSTNSNTTTVVNYFGPSGLNYIPAQPGTLGGFSGATATTVNNAINAGTFMVLHRDHGYYQGWGDPSYSTTSINSLTNVNNKLPFVFSVNCQTGAFHYSSECFSEKMHRYTKNGQNSGALGMIGDAEVSYSFVNDVMVWGMMDYLWPNFMPAYGIYPALSQYRDKRPAFANASAKYFLQQSSWASSSSKLITYRLYHMFGDAFQWIYSEVPQNLTVVHNSYIAAGDTTFDVTANAGSFIAITMAAPNGPIILGTAAGTGSPVTISLSQAPTTSILVTVTKQDYFRYGSNVNFSPTSVNGKDELSSVSLVCYPNPFSQSTTITYELNKAGNVSLTVYDMLGKAVDALINNSEQTSGTHKIEFSSKDLSKGMYSCVLRTDSGVVAKNLVVE